MLVLIVIGALAAWVVPQQPGAHVIDLTDSAAPRLGDVSGIYNTEPGLAGAWSGGSVVAQIHHAFSVAPVYQASIRLRADNPQGAQPLTFFANEKAIATVLPSSSFRTYSMLLPQPPAPSDALRFSFTTGTFTAAINPRELGVILTQIELRPLPEVSWPAVLVVAALVALIWAWLRWLGAPPHHVLLVCASYLVSVILIASLARPAPLRLPSLAGFAAAATLVGAAIAPTLASRVGLALLSVLVSFGGMLWPSWITDDAFISFRYAQNLVAGNGLVYNIGERVEGYTNFLWTILAALALRLQGDLVWLSYCSGVLLGLALMLGTYQFGRRLGHAWALVAALIVATSQSVLVYTSRGSGLETGLFALLVLVGSAWASSRRLERWCGLWFALATLTRPEGALLMAVTLVWLFVSHGQPGAKRPLRAWLGPLLPVLAGYLAIAVPYYLWRTVYYRELLPNTFYAKTGGGLQQVVRGLGYTGAFAWTLGGPIALVGLAALVGDRRAALRQWQGYLLALIVIYTLYIISVGGDHFPGDRFFVPLVPLIALVIADGLARLYRWLCRSNRLSRLALPAVAAAALICALSGLFRGANFDTIIIGDDQSVWIWRELGWWLRDHGPPNASMAALGAGAIAYYSERPVIDLLGLTDKHIARVTNAQIGSGTAGHEKRDPAYVLDVRQPTYIPQLWEEYFGSPGNLRNRYILVTIHTRYGRELKLWQRLP